MPESMLELRGISKSFPGAKALDGVDFSLEAGEIHSLMGENGAGKSTLIKVFTGAYGHDAGTMRLVGEAFAPRTPAEAQARGISTVYQEVNLVPDLSVAENLFIGREPMRFGLVDWRTMRARAQAALDRLGLKLDVDRALGAYSIALQQMVAIARAVDAKARVLVLDEPTSSLDKNEVARLFDTMRALKAQGLGIVFVSHFLDQIYAVSDRITILRNGRLVGVHRAAELPRLGLVAAMTGKSIEAVATAARAKTPVAPDADRVVSATKVGKRGRVEPTDLEIRRGETVGLAGLLGSGRTELAELFFGVHRTESGTVTVLGKPARIRSPRAAAALGIAMLPENRREQGILPRLSVRENIAVALQARRGWWRPISMRKQREMADKFIARLGVATAGCEKPIGLLSGGNQQKVVLARWLASEPQLIILDEPTRGVDVGAKAEIESLMHDLCANGMAILFISAELEEIARDSHRVVVMRDHRKVGELEGAAVTVPNILAAIAGEG